MVASIDLNDQTIGMIQVIERYSASTVGFKRKGDQRIIVRIQDAYFTFDGALAVREFRLDDHRITVGGGKDVESMRRNRSGYEKRKTRKDNWCAYHLPVQVSK